MGCANWTCSHRLGWMPRCCRSGGDTLPAPAIMRRGDVMGTNYYWYPQPPCETCKRPFEAVHIVKSSAGWVFALHIYPEDGINTFDDWAKRFGQADSSILDEYHQTVSAHDMMRTIAERGTWSSKHWTGEPPAPYSSWEKFHRDNGSQPGPHGLLRGRIDGKRTVGHGPGTWDLVVGYFS